MKGISFFLLRELKWASLSPKKAKKYSLVAGPLAQRLVHSPLDLNRTGSNPGRADSALHTPEVDKLSTTQWGNNDRRIIIKKTNTLQPM